MSEPIEEIKGSKKRREKGMQAWAAMLQMQQTRDAQPLVQPKEALAGGSSGPPRDSFRPDTRQDIDTVNRLAALKAAVVVQPQAEVKDSYQTRPKQAPPKAAQAEPAAKPEPKLQPEPKQEAKAAPAAPAPGAKPQAFVVTNDGDVLPQPPSNELATAAPLFTENSVESANQRHQLLGHASIKPSEREEEPTTPIDRHEALAAAEEATFLAALRSGVGADPSKAAKDYVLASQLPGVKDTLQGGIYEEYRVAL